MNRTLLITFAVVLVFWLARALFATELWPPAWLYLIALPGMDAYRLLLASRRDYDGWLAAVTIIVFATIYWSLVIHLAQTSARYFARRWSGVKFHEHPARTLGIVATLKLTVFMIALVSLVVLEVAGPEFAAPLWFDWFFVVLLPGDMANQLLPFAQFSGSAALCFIALTAGLSWTAVAVLIDSVARFMQRLRTRPTVA